MDNFLFLVQWGITLHSERSLALVPMAPHGPGHHGPRGPGQPICHGGHLQALSGMTLRAALSALSPCGMSSKLTLHEIEREEHACISFRL